MYQGRYLSPICFLDKGVRVGNRLTWQPGCFNTLGLDFLLRRLLVHIWVEHIDTVQKSVLVWF